MIFEIPPETFTFTHEFMPEDWAPGIWAGCEGLTFKIASIDMDTRSIKFVVAEEDTQ